jgi:hypothetical protein
MYAVERPSLTLSAEMPDDAAPADSSRCLSNSIASALDRPRMNGHQDTPEDIPGQRCSQWQKRDTTVISVLTCFVGFT